MGYKQSMCKPGQLPIKYIMAMKLKKNPVSISVEVNEFRCSTGCGNYTPEPGQFIKCTVNFIVLSFSGKFSHDVEARQFTTNWNELNPHNVFCN